MTERRRGSLEHDAKTLRIGPSALVWDGHSLRIDIDEVTVPVPRRLRGRIELSPIARTDFETALDPEDLHYWRPLAPCARIEVDLHLPRLCWSGSGYLDSNYGAAPLEDAFTRWHWSRTACGTGTDLLYDIHLRSGLQRLIGLNFDGQGAVHPFEPPPAAELPRTAWGLRRITRAKHGDASLVRTLEDTPFYARSVITTRLGDEPGIGIHESLELDRFRRPLIQAMLPFRMPRARC